MESNNKLKNNKIQLLKMLAKLRKKRYNNNRMSNYVFKI